MITDASISSKTVRGPYRCGTRKQLTRICFLITLASTASHSGMEVSLLYQMLCKVTRIKGVGLNDGDLLSRVCSAKEREDA